MMTDSFRYVIERRADLRVPVDTIAAVHVPDWPVLQLPIRDLSSGGARLAFPFPLATGKRVTVELHMATTTPLALEAEVANVEPGRPWGECVAGLRWVGLSESVTAALRSRVAARAEELSQLLPDPFRPTRLD